jgi:hypothetical protein
VFNPIVPLHDTTLADRIVETFSVDLLIPVEETDTTRAFINRFPHLAIARWRDAIFDRRGCEYADVRHTARRIIKHQDKLAEEALLLPTWDPADELAPLFSVTFGLYPTPNEQIADYGAAICKAFRLSEETIPDGGEAPKNAASRIPPLLLTAYDMVRSRGSSDALNPAVIVGDSTDFDDLVLFWNLRAGGATVCFYDEAYAARLRQFANSFLDGLRSRTLGPRVSVNFWFRREIAQGENWLPDLNLSDLSVGLFCGRAAQPWNGPNAKLGFPKFSRWHRDVVPSYSEEDGKASVSFALPDRPFDDEDLLSLGQKYVVMVDAKQYGQSPDGDLTFETPYIPQMNEFYGRNFYHSYDSVRAQFAMMDKNSVGVITSVSDQRMQVSAYRTYDWMTKFFSLCNLAGEHSEPGLRCKRLISQLGGLQACRVLKIRGVRNLLRKYGVDESFTRTGAVEAIRDVERETGAIGFEAFKNLHIEFRPRGDLTPDDVLRFLLAHRVFRVGLEFKCPNCELNSWIHLDEIKTHSSCPYCDHVHDVTQQLKDRDWRYRRSGIFGRDDDQLGGVPVALTLQQLSTSLNDSITMYSPGMKFISSGADIETCESDFVVVTAGTTSISESPVQVLFGEAKTGGTIDEQDVRKLRKLADAIPPQLAQTFVLFSKTDTFSTEEARLACTLNSPERQRRVILWSRDELEPYFLYERSANRLGNDRHASTLTDMANVTQRLWFS